MIKMTMKKSTMPNSRPSLWRETFCSRRIFLESKLKWMNYHSLIWNPNQKHVCASLLRKFYIHPTLAPSWSALPTKWERPKASLALLGLSQSDLASMRALAGFVSVYFKLHMLCVVSIGALPLPYHPRTAELSLFTRCWRWYVCSEGGEQHMTVFIYFIFLT